jgi:D-xylose transport system substrate-binding protein
MKRGARPTAAAGIGAALLAIGGLAACSSASSTSGTAGGAPSASSSGPITIGVAMKTQQERRWAFDVKAMQEEAAKLGVKLIVQYANNDATTQASQIENLLSQNVSALIVTPVDSKAVASSAAQAKAAGVPVIAYDVGIQGTPIDYEVIRDNPQVGVLQAQAALQFAPSGNYALVEGDAANDVAQAIHGSHVTVLHGQKPEVVYDKFTANWDPNTALSEAENILSANNDQVSAFLTANDGMASSVVQALKARKLAGKVFVSGLDANPQIDKQGQIAVDVATQLAKGQKPQADTQIDNGSGQQIPARVAPVVAITKKNLCDFVNHIAPAGWVTAADAFVNPSDCPAS